jgi:hypothetical protein
MFMIKSAQISPCKSYRWMLSRAWAGGHQLCWIMLNPSTADDTVDDPTICRVIHFTKLWGNDGFTVVNLYPFRSPHPSECRKWADRGPDWSVRDALMNNASVVAENAKKAHMIVAAWGTNAWDSDWIEGIVEDIIGDEEPWPAIYCLGMTKNGSPKHPLARGKHRVPDDQKPLLWRSAR